VTTTATATATATTRRHGLPARAGVAAGLAVIGNLALSQALASAVDADPDFIGLQPASVAVASAFGVLLGVLTFVVLARRGWERLFVPLVAVGALLSLGGPVSLLSATQAQQPGVSDSAALALIPLHVLVATVVAVVLRWRAR
jgi:hypothetical protein